MIRAPLRWLKHLCLALLTLVLVYCATEITLRIYDSYTGQVTLRAMHDRGAVYRSRYVHHELKPLHRVRHKTPQGAAGPVWSTNSFGMRGAEFAVPKAPGTYRIVCLGDERTLAAAIPEGETFCQELQRLLQARSPVPVEVLNAGVPDYCPLLSYLQFRHKLLGLQADLVILNFDMTDVADDYRFRRYTTLDKNHCPLACVHPDESDQRKGKTGGRSCEMLLVPAWAKQHLGRLWASQVLPGAAPGIDCPTGTYLWLNDAPPDWSVYVRQTLSPLIHLQKLTGEVYAELLIVVWPAPWQVAAEACSAGGVREACGVSSAALLRNREPFDILSRFCAQAGILECDLSVSFQSAERGADLFLQDAAELSAAGHRLGAHVMAEHLFRNVRGVWNATAGRSGMPRGDGPRAGSSPRRGVN